MKKKDQTDISNDNESKIFVQSRLEINKWEKCDVHQIFKWFSHYVP